MQLVIGNKNYSSWSLRPWLLMSHFGLQFEEIHIPLFSPEMPALMDKHCPNKKVPTLHDGDGVIWDSLAICEYVNEQYLDGKGYPVDARQRAQARALTAEMHAGFATIRSVMSMDIRAEHKSYDSGNAELAKEIERVDAIWSGDWSEAKGEFLFGDFGIALSIVFLPRWLFVFALLTCRYRPKPKLINRRYWSCRRCKPGRLKHLRKPPLLRLDGI